MTKMTITGQIINTIVVALYASIAFLNVPEFVKTIGEVGIWAVNINLAFAAFIFALTFMAIKIFKRNLTVEQSNSHLKIDTSNVVNYVMGGSITTFISYLFYKCGYVKTAVFNVIIYGMIVYMARMLRVEALKVINGIETVYAKKKKRK